MLLPISLRSASDISLLNHLVLAVCRQGKGNSYLMNELVKTVYKTYYLQRSGFGDTSLELYRQVEAGLKDALAEANLKQIWMLDPETASSLEEVLALYDRQLASAPTWMFVEARGRLDLLIASSKRSPFSD